MNRPQSANAISGKCIDLQNFYQSVVEDLMALSKRISELEFRLSTYEMVPDRHTKLKSLRFLDR